MNGVVFSGLRLAVILQHATERTSDIREALLRALGNKADHEVDTLLRC